MIGGGTSIGHDDDKLITLRIVVHRPKIVRHYGRCGGGHGHRNYDQQDVPKALHPLIPKTLQITAPSAAEATHRPALP